MSYRASLPSSKKTHSEKHKQIFKQLLRENANKTCADCKTSKNPRWASWNIGCFVCIRCSGVHRSMGTHISKVKSVDLDAWQEHEIELMVKWGNQKSNWYWESKLPPDYIPNELKIDNFVRTKYDAKKWIASPNIPDPMSISVETPVASQPSREPQTGQASSSAARSGEFKQAPSANILDDEFGLFSSVCATKVSRELDTRSSLPLPPRAAFDLPSKHSAPALSQTAPSQSAQSTGGSMSSLGGAGGRPDLKKSILSLYSSPASSSSFPQGNQFQPSRQTQNLMNYSGANMAASSLLNLDLNPHSSKHSSNSSHAASPGSPRSVYTGSNTSNTAAMNNVWSNVSSPINPISAASPRGTAAPNNFNGLDSDLFKNVWD